MNKTCTDSVVGQWPQRVGGVVSLEPGDPSFGDLRGIVRLASPSSLLSYLPWKVEKGRATWRVLCDQLAEVSAPAERLVAAGASPTSLERMRVPLAALVQMTETECRRDELRLSRLKRKEATREQRLAAKAAALLHTQYGIVRGGQVVVPGDPRRLLVERVDVTVSAHGHVEVVAQGTLQPAPDLLGHERTRQMSLRLRMPSVH